MALLSARSVMYIVGYQSPPPPFHERSFGRQRILFSHFVNRLPRYTALKLKLHSELIRASCGRRTCCKSRLNHNVKSSSSLSSMILGSVLFSCFDDLSFIHFSSPFASPSQHQIAIPSVWLAKNFPRARCGSCNHPPSFSGYGWFHFIKQIK